MSPKDTSEEETTREMVYLVLENLSMDLSYKFMIYELFWFVFVKEYFTVYEFSTLELINCHFKRDLS